ncbi:MAG TPA: hypothetical protein VFZ09_25865 [Archangium sp.]|nr:hypothetical protein [Archangium sp.]HEX5749684.1 hypothetical protein [Archangium sp.]
MFPGRCLERHACLLLSCWEDQEWGTGRFVAERFAQSRSVMLGVR